MRNKAFTKLLKSAFGRNSNENTNENKVISESVQTKGYSDNTKRKVVK